MSEKSTRVKHTQLEINASSSANESLIQLAFTFDHQMHGGFEIKPEFAFSRKITKGLLEILDIPCQVSVSMG